MTLLTAWHDDCLLFSKWMWTFIQVFILVVYMLHRLRRRRDGRHRRGREVEGEAGEAPPWCNLVEIHHNFWLFCFFISLKILLYGTNPPSVFASVLVPISQKEPRCRRNWSCLEMTGTLLPDGLISWFVFWHCFYIFALIAWHWFGRTCLHQVIC